MTDLELLQTQKAELETIKDSLEVGTPERNLAEADIAQLEKWIAEQDG